jgi:hypothetical protein
MFINDSDEVSLRMPEREENTGNVVLTFMRHRKSFPVPGIILDQRTKEIFRL